MLTSKQLAWLRRKAAEIDRAAEKGAERRDSGKVASVDTPRPEAKDTGRRASS